MSLLNLIDPARATPARLRILERVDAWLSATLAAAGVSVDLDDERLGIEIVDGSTASVTTFRVLLDGQSIGESLTVDFTQADAEDATDASGEATAL